MTKDACDPQQACGCNTLERRSKHLADSTVNEYWVCTHCGHDYGDVRAQGRVRDAEAVLWRRAVDEVRHRRADGEAGTLVTHLVGVICENILAARDAMGECPSVRASRQPQPTE